MIMLDTHALLWWVNGSSALSKPAQKAINTAVLSRSVYASAISSWKIAMLVQRGRLRLALDVRDWLYRCEVLPFLTFVPIGNAIAVESVRLPDFPPCRPGRPDHRGHRLVT